METTSISVADVGHFIRRFEFVKHLRIRGLARYLDFEVFESGRIFLFQERSGSLTGWADGYLAGSTHICIPSKYIESNAEEYVPIFSNNLPRDEFSTVLGVFGTEDTIELNRTAISDGFARIFNRGMYDSKMLMISHRFVNRVILPNAGKYLRQALTLIDGPLCDALHGLDSVKLIDENVLIATAFACTLSKADLKKLWTLLLNGPPDLLIKVTAFSMVEVRDLLLSCDSGADAQDVLLTCASLIPDFNSIVNLASKDIGLEI